MKRFLTKRQNVNTSLIVPFLGKRCPSQSRFSLWSYALSMGILFLLAGGISFLLDVRYSWHDPDTYWHLRIGRQIIETGSIPHEAIHTFDSGLPFIAHEAGFEIVVAFLYRLGGWHALQWLTIASLVVLLWGLYRLAALSRREEGLSGFPPILHLAIAAVICMIYLYFFKLRPQIVSAGAIVWFFIWMRRFREKGSWTAIGMLAVLSAIVSNFHAGVYPVIVVFWGIQLFEALLERRLSTKHLLATLFIVLAGAANPGGLKTITYILQINQNADSITEWQPIDLRHDLCFTAFLFLYVLSLARPFGKRAFRLLFAAGILFLGVGSYKTFLFLLLFLPYELALAVEALPQRFQLRGLPLLNQTRLVKMIWIVLILMCLIRGLTTPYTEDVERYPADEADFIQADWKSAGPPKVLSDYGSSGFLLFRDFQVLADGRYDPFIQNTGKGARGQTPFQRSIGAYQNSDDFMEVMSTDKPDYIIVRKSKKESASIDRIKRDLGTPLYSGRYGDVWRMNGN